MVGAALARERALQDARNAKVLELLATKARHLRSLALPFLTCLFRVGRLSVAAGVLGVDVCEGAGSEGGGGEGITKHAITEVLSRGLQMQDHSFGREGEGRGGPE